MIFDFVNARTRTILLLFFLLGTSLAGCGGGDGPVPGFEDSDTGTDDTGDTSTGPKIGNSSGDDFESGVLGTGVTGMLSAGGNTAVMVSVVDENNELLSGETLSFSFTSSCVAVGLAELSAETVQVTNGQAEIDYTATGCVGEDTITATTTVDDVSMTASVNIEVAADTVSSIEFVSAEPTLISIAGTGGDETSELTFRVLGSLGLPVASQTVSFSLDTLVGGVTLQSGTGTAGGTTNSNGLVTTIVRSGTVNTSVRVTATHVDSGVSTQSNELTISTGITDSNSFDVSLTPYNPEGLNYSGTEVEIIVRMADVFNNPPPDGTAVSFYTEGGSIDPNCVTVNGVCTITWRSQEPRPADGRVEILAYTTGAESITLDNNANGTFDSGDTFEDLDEIFADHNENGVHDAGEFFVDSDTSGDFTFGNTQYDGPLCTNNCSATKTVTIGKSVTIVMSGSEAVLASRGDLPPPPGPIILSSRTEYDGVVISDINGNSLPVGTTISVSAENGTLSSTGSYTILDNTLSAFALPTIELEPDDTPSTGSLRITATTPKGVETVFRWTVTDL